MRQKVRNPPWWALSLIMGVPFGACMTVSSYVQNPGSWTRAAVSGVIAGVLFGAMMGPLFAWQRRKAWAVAGDLSAHDLRIASRAVDRGPAPIDPSIRSAAARLATHQLDQLSRTRWPGLVFFVALSVGATILAVTDSPWWWAATAMFTAFVAAYALWPRHLRRRIEILKT